MESILSVEGLTKTYRTPQHELAVLQDVSFAVGAGSTCAVVGPSGSGKTTLLGLCAGLDRPTRGRVMLAGRDLSPLSEEQLALLRREIVGFVFQTFQLIPTLTALENVMVPVELQGRRGVRDRAAELLAQVGLADRLGHYPAQLSGGEQQRVALARAFVNQPRILFADEPTGNLDAETAETVERLLFDLNRQNGTTLVLVTHNLELAAKTERIISLKGGRIVSDRPTRMEAYTTS
ncbi:MAG: ABC transporter ATP-binding protein [Acidobacteriota bacterium]